MSLQRLILKSTAARMLAIRQVTQLNAGKRTAGIDGKASLNHVERLELSETLEPKVATGNTRNYGKYPYLRRTGQPAS
jgi:hypothetical protein